ncbi:sigma-54-dependent Fis family transcriptional regulator [Sporosarcina pasteurii]|uniref:Nitrogen regulation protein NR(I) n=1 Tax=Sporosarcina pasteurii TaxID=1474 RepID=A0A380BPR8_SPOPA|nr:sigma 54-interacting transcriptional regulator [Sporosarcina pasteurii]MDS9471117.1 sigma 54-interacting transcriptional regulator [Sporosarcina pasteurii]QBQ05241.1 PAS domain S-box protein [Sporosarcina pasteurii]SUJ04840.1 Nitrogen regulation protein NR(I) [Sporosarcina pasteurii]
MQNVLIIGAGTGGSIILDLLQNVELMNVSAIIDTDEYAPGIIRAKELGISFGNDWRKFLHDNVHIIFDVTGDELVFSQLLEAKHSQTVLIPGSVANLIVQLLQENHTYTKRIRAEMHKQRLIFDSIDEGMVGINANCEVDFFNKRASEMVGISIEDAIGKKVTDVIPLTKLKDVFKSGKSEVNQELVLANGLEIMTSRFPLYDQKGEIVGAFAVFKDMTEAIALAKEITDLEKVQTMLEAIIYSSDDAISVVDENGYGILVNPAYTRITGLTKDEVIGKPATADISEGESIHMKVLETKKPVRGVNMRIGENNNEVIVNVAPILMDDELKGSVGIIHDITEMRNLMNELDQARAIIRELESTNTFNDIRGDSAEIKIAIEQARIATDNDFTVLLRGEVGSGKALFAQAIHSEGTRKFNKFIRVNCTAIPPDVLEAKLFGKFSEGEKGKKEKTGLFEEIDNGTLFLDEIADLSLSTQRKLLHYLKTGEFYAVGSARPIQTSVHIITATCQNLEKAIHDGTFLAELYYLLNRIAIQIPPLRSRKEDIAPIVQHLLVKLNNELGMNVEVISYEAKRLLEQYDWPGNIRELENVINRAMIYMEQSEMILEAADVKKSLFSSNRSKEKSSLPAKSTLTSMMDDYERSILEQALTENEGNKSETANRLGISLRSLYYKLDKYNLA